MEQELPFFLSEFEQSIWGSHAVGFLGFNCDKNWGNSICYITTGGVGKEISLWRMSSFWSNKRGADS